MAIFWGISPYIALKNRPYIWNRYLQSIGSCCMAIDSWLASGCRKPKFAMAPVLRLHADPGASNSPCCDVEAVQ